MPASELLPAAAAFDAAADGFDARFGAWLSVAAQRRAVRRALADAFPPGSRLLEIGGGTGEDAAWLCRRDRSVLLTDPSPTMVRLAARKLGGDAVIALPAERLDRLVESGMLFDGAFSNFAALNCVAELAPVGESLARLVRPGGKVALVLFGRFSPGEILVELARGRFRNAIRRFRRVAPAAIGGNSFTVRYHGSREIRRAMAPWFRPAGRTAIGLFVPPSSAEPWISRHPRLLASLEAADRLCARRLALLGDHILFVFQRRRDEDARS